MSGSTRPYTGTSGAASGGRQYTAWLFALKGDFMFLAFLFSPILSGETLSIIFWHWLPFHRVLNGVHVLVSSFFRDKRIHGVRSEHSRMTRQSPAMVLHSKKVLRAILQRWFFWDRFRWQRLSEGDVSTEAVYSFKGKEIMFRRKITGQVGDSLPSAEIVLQRSALSVWKIVVTIAFFDYRLNHRLKQVFRWWPCQLWLFTYNL